MRNIDFLPRLTLLLALLLPGSYLAQAQTPGVGIGTTAPDVSAALDIVSSTKGVLLPRVASATAIATPATGLLVFQTNAPAGFYYNAGTPGTPDWQQIATASGAAVTASNGLTRTGQNIALGGTLTQPTAISGITSTNTLELTGTAAPLITNTTAAAPASTRVLGLRGSYSSAIAGSGAHLSFLEGGGNEVGRIASTQDAGSYLVGLSFSTTNGSAASLAERLRISPAGNVGIGTSAPATRLDVRTADGSARLTVGTTANTGGGIAFGNTGHGIQRGYPTLNAGNNVGFYTTGGNLYLAANGPVTNQFVLTNAGNVGIGTITPLARQETVGDLRVTYASSGAGTVGTATADSFVTGSFANFGQSFTLNAATTITSVTLRSESTYATTLTIKAGAGNAGAALTAALPIAFTANSPATVTLPTPLSVGAGVYTLVLAVGNQNATHGNVYDGGTAYIGTNVQENFDLEFIVGFSAGPGTALYAGAGSVGVNTGTPTATLDVAGTTRLRGLSTAGVVTTDASGNLGSSSATTAFGTAFIQNGTTQQTGADFNISGSGTVGGTLTAQNAVVTTALTGNGASLPAGVVGVGIRADGGLNIGQNPTVNSIYLGYKAGAAITTGVRNHFVGDSAGLATTTGLGNHFDGYRAGLLNTTGGYNLALGYLAGRGNTTGSFNTFIGLNSGAAITTGTRNHFVGYRAGQSATGTSNSHFDGYRAGELTTTGLNNHFSGYFAGNANTIGEQNYFSGHRAGLASTEGSRNAFAGYLAGANNTTGSDNTALGANSGPASGSGALTNATALGANVSLTTSNTVILGNNANVGIGTPNPGQKLEVTGNALVSGGVRVDGGVTNNGTFPATRTLFSGLLFGPSGTGETIGSNRSGTGNNPYGLDLYTGFVPRLRISQAGNVGIGTTAAAVQALEVTGSAVVSGNLGVGTTAPGGRLHLVNDGGGAAFIDDYLFDEYGNGDQAVFLRRAGGTVAAPANLVNGDYIGGLTFVPRYNGAALGYTGSSVQGYYTGDGTTFLTDLRLKTANTERLRIDGAGKVGIGTTTPTSLLDLGSSAGAAPTDAATRKLALFNNAGGTDFYGFGVSSGALQIFTSAAAGAAPDMTIENNGSVGINNTNPNSRLDVVGNMQVSNPQGSFQVHQFSPDLGTILMGTFAGAGNYGPQLRFTGGGTTPANYVDLGQDAAGSFTVETNDVARLTVLGQASGAAAGNVGIGTTIPRGAFDVASAGSSYLVADPNSGNGQTLYVPGHLFLAPYTGTTGATYIQARVPNPTASTNLSLVFRTTNGGGLVDALTINANGSATFAGPVTATSFSPSDQRLKQHIRPLTGALGAVLALRGVRYAYRQDVPGRSLPTGEQVGVLAQEVEKLYPELVSTGPDGYKAVNYAQLTPVLIEALKEQQQQIEALKARAATAEAKADALETAATQAAADHASLLTLQSQMARLLSEQPTATLPAPANR